ncbi:MAG: hypothetical protein ACHQVS_01885 [Candidatus Babeliales bacterium]
MKKLYITLVRPCALFFALLVGLAATQSNACDCSCLFRCLGEQDQVQQITINVAPTAQAMPAPAVQIPKLELEKPQRHKLDEAREPQQGYELKADTRAPARQPHKPQSVNVLEKVRQLPPSPSPTLTLTRKQLSRIKKPSQAQAVQYLPAQSVTISISPAFKAHIIEPQEQDPKRILLDAIKGRDRETALQLLDSGALTKEQLTARSKYGKTPILYAIRHEYWDVATKLVQLNVEIPEFETIRTVVIPDEEPEKYRRCLIGYASLCFASLN